MSTIMHSQHKIAEGCKNYYKYVHMHAPWIDASKSMDSWSATPNEAHDAYELWPQADSLQENLLSVHS